MRTPRSLQGLLVTLQRLLLSKSLTRTPPILEEVLLTSDDFTKTLSKTHNL